MATEFARLEAKPNEPREQIHRVATWRASQLTLPRSISGQAGLSGTRKGAKRTDGFRSQLHARGRAEPGKRGKLATSI